MRHKNNKGKNQDETLKTLGRMEEKMEFYN